MKAKPEHRPPTMVVTHTGARSPWAAEPVRDLALTEPEWNAELGSDLDRWSVPHGDLVPPSAAEAPWLVAYPRHQGDIELAEDSGPAVPR